MDKPSVDCGSTPTHREGTLNGSLIQRGLLLVTLVPQKCKSPIPFLEYVINKSSPMFNFSNYFFSHLVKMCRK